MSRYVLFISLMLVLACGKNSSESGAEAWKKEILDTESQFADMVLEQGVPEAFMHFADENAVLLRNNRLIKGREAIGEYFRQRQEPRNVKLSWKTDYVKVARAGDMAYTYGKYQFTMTDSTGAEQVTDGIFHTVWKRQEDGSWKYVWD